MLNFLKGLANIKQNHQVLINGASGALGTYAVQSQMEAAHRYVEQGHKKGNVVITIP